MVKRTHYAVVNLALGLSNKRSENIGFCTPSNNRHSIANHKCVLLQLAAVLNVTVHQILEDCKTNGIFDDSFFKRKCYAGIVAVDIYGPKVRR